MHLSLTAVSVFVSHTCNRAASLCHIAVFHLELGPFSTVTDMIWCKPWSNRTTKAEVTGFTPGCVYKKRTKSMWSIYVDLTGSVSIVFICSPNFHDMFTGFLRSMKSGDSVWFQTIILTPFSKIDHSWASIQGCMRTDLSDLDLIKSIMRQMVRCELIINVYIQLPRRLDSHSGLGLYGSAFQYHSCNFVVILWKIPDS